MKLAIWATGVSAVFLLAVPATADVRPAVAKISKGSMKLAALSTADGSRLKVATSMKGVDGKPKTGHPDDPSRPHPERVSP